MTTNNDIDFPDFFTPEETLEMIRYCENNAAAERLNEDAALGDLIEAIVHEVGGKTDLEIKEHIEHTLRVRRGW